MSNENTVLTASNLQIGYEGEQIINDLSFTVEKSDILIFLGPNGAGKTLCSEHYKICCLIRDQFPGMPRKSVIFRRKNFCNDKTFPP
jgi:ABC-type lipopolysaccharide export system ATPase subunit